jgi:CheY-like chemotaxis protein
MKMPSPVLLVVEDEPAIQMLIEAVLEEAGFEVRVATFGEEAIGTLNDSGFQPVGMITDIRLGQGIKGWDVARHARERHPEIAVVYVTGDSAADWAAYGVPKSLLVPKPFANAQLVTAMTTLLNEHATKL